MYEECTCMIFFLSPAEVCYLFLRRKKMTHEVASPCSSIKVSGWWLPLKAVSQQLLAVRPLHVVTYTQYLETVQRIITLLWMDFTSENHLSLFFCRQFSTNPCSWANIIISFTFSIFLKLIVRCMREIHWINCKCSLKFESL